MIGGLQTQAAGPRDGHFIAETTAGRYEPTRPTAIPFDALSPLVC